RRDGAAATLSWARSAGRGGAAGIRHARQPGLRVQVALQDPLVRERDVFLDHPDRRILVLGLDDLEDLGMSWSAARLVSGQGGWQPRGRVALGNKRMRRGGWSGAARG